MLPLGPLLALAVLPSRGVSLSLQSEEAPYPGVTLRHYHTASPTTQTWVLLVDLCAERVHVDATRAPSSYASTGAWASDRGVQAATNGDFYTSGPRVYGDAVGEGISWPLDQTGRDPAVAGEWYAGKYGWFAFLHDRVEYTHTEWTKENRDVSGGWAPDTVAPDPPPGTLALVSGFPELVVEGEQVTCSSPTASDCFPDRSDMRDRHPRTAMGLTEDRQTFILAVVDGRTSSSAGMYGAELAELMATLGAWEAFNLDGGGSSQMWISGDGYVNDYDGNNNGNGLRSVTNHWGVFAGSASGRSARPGHCASWAPCGTLPPEGGVVDDTSPCFARFGDPTWWRSEDDGYGGHLWWTNAWNTDQPENWAWWRLHLERAGTYLVEVYADPGWSVFDAAHYVVAAGGEVTDLAVDLSAAEGWLSLGTWDFDAGGDQWVALYDDHDGSVPSDQHIPADAVRLTRVGGGDTADTGAAPETDDPRRDSGRWGPGSRRLLGSGEGCGGCAGHGIGRGRLPGALALALLLRRRRRPGTSTVRRASAAVQ